MSFTWADIALLAVMLISGLLALMRGFFREILSLGAWGGAAGAAAIALFYPDIRKLAADLLVPYIGDNEIVVSIAIAGAVFLVVLIILSIISVKLSDALLDSSAGPIDRTVGFIYGLGRGLVLMVTVFMLYVWFFPRDKIDPAVREASTLPLVAGTANFLTDTLLTTGVMPPEVADDLKGKIGNPSTLGTRRDSEGATGGGTASEGDTGYRTNQRSTLDQIIESTQGQQ